jgi:hypothetical protein
VVAAFLKSPRNRLSAPLQLRSATDVQSFPSLRQSSQGAINTFPFFYPPTNIQYDSLAPEWVEVERPGFVPIVGLRQYRLMRIQFDFLVTNSYDGIWYSVDDQLLLLREMANKIDPVFFQGMDKLTLTPINLPGSNRDKANGMFFRIVELNINSLRRNTKNEITAAQCSITMQEDFILAIKAVSMPKINYPPILKPRVKSSKNDGSTDKPRCNLSVATTNCKFEDVPNLSLG